MSMATVLPEDRVPSLNEGFAKPGRKDVASVSFRGDRPPGSASSRQVGGGHYKGMKIEPWDVVDTWPLEQRVGAYRYAALKYIMRLGAKDERADEALKGAHCAEKLGETLTIGEP